MTVVEEADDLTETDLRTGWRPAADLFKKIDHEGGAASFAPASLPDGVEIAPDQCAGECNSRKSAILTCPGVYYPAARSFHMIGGRFLRHTNGTEDASDIAHEGFWFYTCDDFCGGQPDSGCSPGSDERESEFGIGRALEDNRFKFYQSYDSNNCGARHRVDDLNPGFAPEATSSTFEISVLSDGSYRVRQLRADGNEMASQRITNCTLENDCGVICGGSTPGALRQGCEQGGTDQTCPVSCQAKHRDEVNLFRSRTGGKINVHMMKKHGPEFAWWSRTDASGLPSRVLVDAIKVESAGPAEGLCALE
jgi:hypothetical protein